MYDKYSLDGRRWQMEKCGRKNLGRVKITSKKGDEKVAIKTEKNTGQKKYIELFISSSFTFFICIFHLSLPILILQIFPVIESK